MVSGLQPVSAILTHVYIKSQICFSWNENHVTLPEQEICFLGAWNRTQTVKASGSWKINWLTHLMEGRKLLRGKNHTNKTSTKPKHAKGALHYCELKYSALSVQTASKKKNRPTTDYSLAHHGLHVSHDLELMELLSEKLYPYVH